MLKVVCCFPGRMEGTWELLMEGKKMGKLLPGHLVFWEVLLQHAKELVTLRTRGCRVDFCLWGQGTSGAHHTLKDMALYLGIIQYGQSSSSAHPARHFILAQRRQSPTKGKTPKVARSNSPPKMVNPMKMFLVEVELDVCALMVNVFGSQSVYTLFQLSDVDECLFTGWKHFETLPMDVPPGNEYHTPVGGTVLRGLGAA
eukprot:864218-Amphidinium_carterae.1